MKLPNFPNLDRSIDMLLVTGVAIGLKAFCPWISLLEIMGLTGTVGMWCLGQIRAIRNQYPYNEIGVESFPVYFNL